MLDIFAQALKGVGWFALLWLTLPALLLFRPNSTLLINISRHVIEIVDSVSLTIGQLIKWGLPLLVFSVAISVFALSLFGLSWTKLFESAQYIHATVIMLGAAMTLLLNEHVRVDIFQSKLKRPQKALVDFIGFHVGLMPVCLILIWSSNSFIGFSWQTLEGSAESDGIRGLYLLKTLIPIFAVMMLAQGLSISLRAVMVMRSLNEPKRPPHVEDVFPVVKGGGQ